MNRRNIQKLIEVYRAIEKYQAQNDAFPSHTDLVRLGIASSTSVVSYYFQGMESLRMLRRVPLIARSSKLMPLDQADPAVQEYLKHEQ